MRPVSPRGSAPRRRVYAACVAGLAAAALTASACDSNKGLDPATNVPSEVSSSGVSSSGGSGSSSHTPIQRSPTPWPATADSPTSRTTSSSSPQSPTTSAPPTVSTKPTSASARPTLSAQDRRNAIQALASYNRVAGEISHDPPSKWRSSLSHVAAPDVVNAALGTLNQIHAHGLVSYGIITTKVIDVVPGPKPHTAIVKNCQDSSKAGLVYPNGEKYTVGRKMVYDEAFVGVLNGKWVVVGGPKPKRKTC